MADNIGQCRITKNLAYMRRALDSHGRSQGLARSCVRVDEDFHYMRGKNGANDDYLRMKKQSWPKRSVFNACDTDTLPLNPTLSLSCGNTEVEALKECLFKDPFKSRSRFLNIRDGGKDGYHTTNDDEYFCCECEYVKCDHFNDATHLKESSRLYLSAMCPVCVFKIGKSCNRSDGDCCIKKWKGETNFLT